MKRIVSIAAAVGLAAVGAGMPAAAASTAIARIAGPVAIVNANQSSNWFGYSQGLLEKGTPLQSITGTWTVPTASQHTAGDSEYSSTWIGLGGGCVDSGCTVTDETLIQTGTEQDVSGGTASYSAWWEIVPDPSTTITTMTVHPGDQMSASIQEVVPDSEVWTITLRDVTRGETFTQTIPYTSTFGTAEWIEETPLILGTNAGFAALPNLTQTSFTGATVNGANPGLTAADEMQLVNSNGAVYATPSAPNSSHNGGDLCAWATSCS